MKFNLPKGRQVEVNPFAVVAMVLAIAAFVVDAVVFGLTRDLDMLFVGWASNAFVASITGYVVFRLGGGSLRTASRGMRIIINVYFWGGLWLLAGVTLETATEQGWAEASHLVSNNVTSAVLVSLVLGTVYLAAGSSPATPGDAAP